MRYEELSDAVHFEAHHVRLHQVAIITGKLPRLLLDEVCFFVSFSTGTIHVCNNCIRLLLSMKILLGRFAYD